MDGGGDATGFVFDTSTLSLLGTSELTAGLTHNTLRGEFRPVGSTGSADFFVYTTHLKAGNDSTNASIRAAEASVLRADVDSLGAGAQVIMAGDFNVYTSLEGAYSTFLSAGSGQLTDPISTPGNWHDNSAFRSVHTQNPADPALGGGGMDDRFDFQLVTGEFYDGVGVDYISGSYRAFGNNGTHAFNGSITSGTGASPTVLAALANASDHLPVVADYEVIGVGGVAIVESGGSSVVAEGGNFDTYEVVLTSVPQSNVTVTVTPDVQTDIGAGAGESVAFVFTPANALTSQTIVVLANDDSDLEGTHQSTITHSSVSGDAEFDGLAIPDVVVTVLDNDAPGIVINEVDSDTVSVDSLEFVELYDGGIGDLPLDGLAVVFFNGNNNQSYAAYDLDGFSTDSNGFFLLGNSAVGPDISFNSNGLQNGADAVTIYAANATDFPNGTAVTTTNLIDALVYDTDDADDSELLPLLLPGQPQVNENGNNNREFDSLSRIPDGGAQRETTTYVAQAPTPRALNAPPSTGIIVSQSAGRTDVEEGGITDSYTLALTTFPSSDVTVTVTPDSQVDLGAGAGAPIALNFTSGNALLPQTILVTAVDDSLIEGPHTSAISHSVSSADSGYDGISIGDVIVNVADNETAPQVSVVISEIMYNPDSDETSPGVGEWIEVVNKGNVAVDISGWSFDDEDSTDWGAVPNGTSLGVHQVAVFFDSAFTTEVQFRSSWYVPSAALVIGIPWGSLANSPSPTNEILQLLDNVGTVQDEVNFDDSMDWPSDSTDGSSIFLPDVTADNNVGTNWAKSNVGTDNAVMPNAPFSSMDVGSPGFVDCPNAVIDGDFDDDGDYDCADIDALVVAIVSGANASSFDLTSDGVVDQADLTAWLVEAGTANLSPGNPYLPGDANLDGFVDVTDFNQWNAFNFTPTPAWCSGDFNADGVVDASDFNLWNSNKFTGSVVVFAFPNQQEPVAQTLESLIDRVFQSDEQRVQDLPAGHVAHATLIAREIVASRLW